MRLTIVGGGGFRVPLVYRALIRDAAARRVTEVVLYDADADRARAIGHVLAQLAAADRDRSAAPPHVRVTARLDDAVAGADFVFSAIRVGGMPGRIADERVAIAHGLLGQETVGAGGIAYGLRTIPVALDLARRVRALAPQAWLINFTNPAGLVTEAMGAILGERVVGICDSPLGLARRAARALGIPLSECTIDYAGLNHLGWLQGLVHDETDLLPTLLADDARLARIEEGQVFGVDRLRDLGAIPNEYLHYYDDHEAERAAQRTPGYRTRGEFLARQQQDCFAALAASPGTALGTWEAVLAGRNATYMAGARGAGSERDEQDLISGGYEEVALALMAALARDEPARLILNVAAGARLGLPADAVVELPCRVDGAGVAPLPTSPLRPAMADLVATVKTVERMVIDAAITGRAETAEQALALHPLVGEHADVGALLADYRRAIPAVDAVFAGR